MRNIDEDQFFNFKFIIVYFTFLIEVAVGEGFEPPELSFNGFQDRRLKPLGHPTNGKKFYPLFLKQYR